MRIRRGMPVAALLLLTGCGSPQHQSVPGAAVPAPEPYFYAPAFTSVESEPPAAAAAPAPMAGRGRITWYRPAGSPSACGPMFADTDLVAAVSGALWTTADRNDDPLCGRTLTVTDTADDATVTVRVEDLCPSCDTARIELSRAAFARLADLGDGTAPATWQTR